MFASRLIVVVAVGILMACANNPVGPSSVVDATSATAAGADTSLKAPVRAEMAEAALENPSLVFAAVPPIEASTKVASRTATVNGNALQVPILNLPKPVITRLGVTSAAPGVMISVYGRDLNPPGALVGPKVVFAGGPGGYFPQSAQAISNTELRVVVPPGSGSASVQVQTAGGTTSNVSFTYKVPVLTSISPASGPRGLAITLTGMGFGVKQSLDPSYLKFGDSVVQATEWTDQRIVVKSPMDFGTGLNSDILLSAIGCLSGSAATGFEKWIIKASLPSCTTLIKSAFQRYQLSQNASSITKSVSVTVRTSVGVSNGRTFTYTVQTENR